MEKCDYGCNQEAKFTFKNGKRCCSPKYRSCPFQAAEIGKTRLGKKHSEETKKKIGKKSKERIEQNGGSYFKGKKHSEETKRTLSEQKRGNIPWNKGLTQETDDRILSSAQKNSDGRTANFGNANGMYGRTHSVEVKENQRQRNLKERKWQGTTNPWYGKDRSKENSPRYLTDVERTQWESYRQIVRMLTERTYKQHLTEINPNGHNRATREYHLDHIIPIWYGFINDILPITLALKENLRIIRWSNNLKRSKTTLTEEEQILLHQLEASL